MNGSTGYLQVIISVLVGSDTDRETQDDGRKSVSHGIIEAHVSMIDVTELGQHSVQVNRLDHQPREDAQPQVVETHGQQFTNKLCCGQGNR